jgi:hypothetical protein
MYCRYGISNMAAAALANGLLKDLGYIDENDCCTEVVDASKIMREKASISGQKYHRRKSPPDLKGLKVRIGVDSKHDSTMFPQLQ